MGKSQNWDMVMRFQRKNGSLFDSPSTTAASLSHTQNIGCLNYLHNVLEKFGDAGTSFTVCINMSQVLSVIVLHMKNKTFVVFSSNSLSFTYISSPLHG